MFKIGMKLDEIKVNEKFYYRKTKLQKQYFFYTRKSRMQKQVTTFPLSTVNIITSYLEKAIFIDNTANLTFFITS